MSSAATTPNDPWVVFDYEVDMLTEMCVLLQQGNARYAALPHHVRNAVVESAVLHARSMVDILLSRGTGADDIRLSDLVPGFASKTLDELRAAYGDGKTVETPCWAFNKKLAHPTRHRTDTYDYAKHLNAIVPLVLKLVGEIHPHRP